MDLVAVRMADLLMCEICNMNGWCRRCWRQQRNSQRGSQHRRQPPLSLCTGASRSAEAQDVADRQAHHCSRSGAARERRKLVASRRGVHGDRRQRRRDRGGCGVRVNALLVAVAHVAGGAVAAAVAAPVIAARAPAAVRRAANSRVGVALRALGARAPALLRPAIPEAAVAAAVAASAVWLAAAAVEAVHNNQVVAGARWHLRCTVDNHEMQTRAVAMTITGSARDRNEVASSSFA